MPALLKTRPDTRLPQSRAGGQGPLLRSVEHLGRSNEAKTPINAEKVKCDGWTDGWTDRPTDQQTDRPTDGPTKRGVESRSTRLKIFNSSLSCYFIHSSLHFSFTFTLTLLITPLF